MRKKKPKDPNRRNKALRIRLYPNDEQKVLIAKTFGCARQIYNDSLHISMEHYDKTGKHYQPPYTQIKKEHDYMKEVDCMALVNARLNLETAYKNFFDLDEHHYSAKTIEKAKRTGKELTSYNLEKHPKYKSKKEHRKSYTTNLINGNIELGDGYIKLPKLGEVKMTQHRFMPNDYKLKSVTVSITASGKYYASIIYEYSKAIEPVEVVTALGLDFSMSEGFVDSNGNSLEYPKFYRKAEKRLAMEQRKLSHMVKDSKNYEKQRLKIAKLHEHVAAQRKDFLHKESRKIANSYDLVGVEDLDMRAMSKSLKFGKSVHDVGWGMFRTFLKYKLEEQGKHYIVIDKWFPSSKKCSTPGCTYHYADLTLDIREWTCPICGAHHHRDWNAAINVREEALRVYHEWVRAPRSA